MPISRTPTIWITTDTHFGHKNMIKLCNRPENFSDLIMKNINEMVSPSDVLIHLGDVTFNNEVPKFPCKTILVKGNHDKRSYGWYMRHGFDFVCESFSLIYNNKDIIFTHKPLIFHEHDINIYGHLHNIAKVESECPGILVALEYTKYKPVLLNTLLQNMDKEQELLDRKKDNA